MSETQIKRRGFFGAVAGLLAAPFALAKAMTPRVENRDDGVEVEYKIMRVCRTGQGKVIEVDWFALAGPPKLGPCLFHHKYH